MKPEVLKGNSKFSLELINGVWTIEDTEFTWFEFEEEEEQEARSILAQLQDNNRAEHIL